MLPNTYKKEQKTSTIFRCEKCDYITSRNSNYLRHLKTKKHNDLQTTYKKEQKGAEKYFCENCNKKYKHRQSYYNHKKQCFSHQEITNKNVQNSVTNKNEIVENNRFDVEKLHDIIEKQSHQINELTNIIKDVVPKIGNTTNNKIIVNNKMSINVFLNEKCKNAMNLTDFMEQIRVTDDDLQYTKQNGYIKGMTNIFQKNLLTLETSKRPVHCSDIKRLQFYIKDENKWDKDKELKHINKTLCILTDKNIKQLQQWKLKNPNWSDDDKLHDEFLQITRNILYGYLDEVGEKAKNKIIKNLADLSKIDIK